jgi:hypothetical protein
MGPPGGVLCITLDNDGVFVQCVSQGEGGLRLLPRVEVVGLLPSKPIWQRPPNI